MITLVECGCCGAYHREEFDGDCREDDERFPVPTLGCWGCGSHCGVTGCAVCYGEKLCERCQRAGVGES